MSWSPSRELLREYGRVGPGVRGFWKPDTDLGAGLLNRGGLMALLEKPDGVMEPFLLGVRPAGARDGVLRSGDSGLDSDGLLFGLNCGLGARAPGPRDCVNFGSEGVSGLL